MLRALSQNKFYQWLPMHRGSMQYLLNLAGGSLNTFSGLSLFTLVFFCIFPAWPMGTCGFCLSCFGFLGDKCFSLSLTVFGVWIGDLYKSYFVEEDFPLLRAVVHDWVIDFVCIFPWTTSLDFSLFVTCWVWASWNLAECSFFSGAPETLPNHLVPTGSVSLPELKICCLDWLDLPSVQERRSCSLQYRTLLFSLLPGRVYSNCTSLLFFFVFDRYHTILR